MNEREQYRGTYADYGKHIKLPNSSAPVKNEDLLKKAAETRAAFYEQTFALIKSLPKLPKVD